MDQQTPAPAAPNRDELYTRAATVAAFVAGAVAFAFFERDTLSGQCIVAAAALALPHGALARIPGGRAAALALAIGIGGLAQGCSPAQIATAGAVAHTVATTSCGVIEHAARVCAKFGLAPDQPCPAAVPVTITVDGNGVPVPAPAPVAPAAPAPEPPTAADPVTPTAPPAARASPLGAWRHVRRGEHRRAVLS